MHRFEQLTIVVLASNERDSLRETFRLILKHCAPEDIYEIIVFFISEDCPANIEFKKMMEEESFPVPVRGEIQQHPGLSQAIYEIPLLVKSSHFLIIASDLEMDPCSVPELIALSKINPDAIVCASKWKKGSKIQGYSFLHMIGVCFINLLVECILHIKGTELISTFQIYPYEVYQRMHFSDPTRIFYQFTIKPLVFGVPYIEIPTNYKRRIEGKSNFRLIPYLRIGITFVLTALQLRKQKRIIAKSDQQ